jgi:hypothetical protein
VFDWRGSDLPAQVFRSELVRRDGFVVWNSQWFGGHAVLTYSVLSPVLGALIGPVALGAISCVVASVTFERILRFAFGHAAWVGALWFALGSVTNLIVGRVTFALGVALGLIAVYALQRRHPIPAVIAAVLCSLSSPLAGVFLLIATIAWACARAEDRVHALAVSLGAVLPLATIAVLFPSTGRQPYDLWALIWDLSFCAVLFFAAGRVVGLQWAAGWYAAASIGAFIVPTPLGGNISRLCQYLMGPMLAVVLWPRRRMLFAALAIPLLWLQWYPAIDGIAFARTDPSTREAYYTPMVDFVRAQDGPIGRVEIPFTFRHWETAYVAKSLMLARGWERQLDIEYESIFYEGPLTPASYRDWLVDNGVEFVALPDARLDESSLGERELLERGLPYLEPVWSNAHWRVWRVRDFHGLVDGPASLVALEPDRFTVDVREPADIVVRVRESRHWLVEGDGCAGATDDGWTVLRGLQPGTVEVTQSLGATACPD